MDLEKPVNSAQKKILVVEDEVIIAEDIRNILRSLGYHVTGIATTGSKTMDLIRSDPPDLVMMDIKIQGPMDGIETTRRIQSEQDIPVVFLTAYADPDTMARIKQTRAYGFIVKPANRQTIQGTVELAIFKHRMDRELRIREDRLNHLNQVLRAIRNVNQLITKETDRSRLIRGACDNLIETLGYQRSWIGLFGKSSRFTEFAYTGPEIGFAALKNMLTGPASTYPPCVKQALKRDGISIASGEGSVCTSCPLLEQDRAFCRFTMKLRYADEMFGVMSVAVPAAYRDDAEEQGLFRELVDDVAFALYKIGLEEAREKAEEEIRSLSKFPSENPHPVLRIDADGQVLYCNEAGRALYTFTKTSSSSMLKKQWKNTVRGIFESGEINHKEIDVKDKTYAVTFAPVPEFRYVNLYGLDVTERKRTEIQLGESEEKYHALFNQSVEGIFLHDLDGRILDVNRMACRQTGYSREELLQIHIHDLWPGEIGQPSESVKTIQRQWKTWKPEQRFVIETEHRRKDGAVFPVQISTGPIRYGDKMSILAIVQDITKRRRMEQKLEQIENRLKREVNAVREELGRSKKYDVPDAS